MTNFRGKLAEGDNAPIADELMETKLVLLPQKECLKYEYSNIYNTDSMVCAYGGETDTCEVQIK